MAEVFISYSRHDSSFVHRLHDALRADGREVWVDFEGIPPSAEWMNEIHGAIEAAESFVYIITPHSAASAVCAQEVAHALEHNKRLIPVMRQDVDASLLPKSVWPKPAAASAGGAALFVPQSILDSRADCGDQDALAMEGVRPALRVRRPFASNMAISAVMESYTMGELICSKLTKRCLLCRTTDIRPGGGAPYSASS